MTELIARPIDTSGSTPSPSDVPSTGTEVRLVARPADGRMREDLFEVVDVAVPETGEGEVLVRNDWMLLGVIMGELVSATEDGPLPMPRFQLGEVPYALTVGTVVRSRSESLHEGDLVTHRQGWREWAHGADRGFAVLPRTLLPGPEYFLTQGPTAYRGMVELAEVGPGDTVLVTGAAGGVGAMAGQIARARGAARVIGSAGSAAKVDYLVSELGFDAAFDYHDGPLDESLRRCAPGGLDVVFDNVGGEQLAAAVRACSPGARLSLCGRLSGADPVLPFAEMIPKDLTLRAFSTSYRPDRIRSWHEQFGAWLAEGAITFPRTTFPGGPAVAPGALVALTESRCTGQVLVGLRTSGGVETQGAPR